MIIIPCKQNKGLRDQMRDLPKHLQTEAHKLGDHGLGERELYQSCLFRGAIEPASEMTAIRQVEKDI
ncbi:MAG: hypothetical protein ABF968_03075 [Acetobacter sp.]|uniref:hypothetical protein n=1 Tax=Acetobacter sp. TaxID=440 RepID=UPI0039E8AADB